MHRLQHFIRVHALQVLITHGSSPRRRSLRVGCLHLQRPYDVAEPDRSGERMGGVNAYDRLPHRHVVSHCTSRRRIFVTSILLLTYFCGRNHMYIVKNMLHIFNNPDSSIVLQKQTCLHSSKKRWRTPWLFVLISPYQRR